MATQGYQQEYQNYQQSGQQGQQHYDPYGGNVENYYQVYSNVIPEFIPL